MILSLVLSVALSGCNSQSTQSTQISERSLLRVINNGSYPIENLVVWFPDEQIIFGDVAVGETTEYVEAPKGVYSYAAYKYDIGGQEVTQPVIDWMGENPIEGDMFTYVVDFDPHRFGVVEVMHLIEVKVDN